MRVKHTVQVIVIRSYQLSRRKTVVHGQFAYHPGNEVFFQKPGRFFSGKQGYLSSKFVKLFKNLRI